MADIYPVQTVDDAYDACHPDEALRPGDSRYVDLTAVRGGDNLARIVSRRVRRTRPPHFHQQLVSGHRGSGKSTELRQLQACLLNESFFAIYLDVEDVLDLGEIKYQDVLIAIARAIAEDLRDAKIDINQRLVEELVSWFDERILTQEEKEEQAATLKGEASVEGKVPFLARVLASITGELKSGSSQRTEIRQKLELELSGFIARLNTLLTVARQGVQKQNYHDLVLLVDGLEKMQYLELADGESTHSVLFIHHAEQLKAPECHLVYTVPISLVFRVNLGNAFPDAPFLLPMVDYKRSDGKEKLREIISERIAIEKVFDSEQAVGHLVKMSGGSVRDLMRLVRMSCDTAETQISQGDVERACRKLINEFDRFVQDEDIESLRSVAREHTISFGKTAARLLALRLVHEYQNGERWADIHPAVKEVPRVREALKELSA